MKTKSLPRSLKCLLVGVMSFVTTGALADEVKVSINGMVCAFCAQGITKKLEETKVAEKINVDLSAKTVSFSEKSGATLDDAAITKVITDSGYSVVKIERSKK